MAKPRKEIKWLQKNKEYLSISGIEKKAGIPRTVLVKTINGNIDGHGTPFKVPDKYHEKLIETIKQIRKA